MYTGRMTDANPINITRIDHVVLRVENLPSMIRFYRDALGCRLEKGPGDSGLAQLRCGDSLIDLVAVDSPLGKAGGGAPDHGAPNVDHVCFLVDPWDAELVRERLVAHGIDADDVANRYGATGYGPSIYFDDPEGNRIELKGPR